MATILATAMVSGRAEGITSIPAVAAMKVLAKAGMALTQVHLIEINEAFAAVPMVASLILAENDAQTAEELRERVNVNGGAIALGHPTGATGARLVITLVHELRRRGGGIGLVAICGGVGEGEALLLEVEG
jgi:acetyl-CoA C-acetyltransferase